MNRQDLFERIKAKQSYLCIGLDTDLEKIPPHLLEQDDPVYEFNKQIIQHTQDLCVAYKPNIAFYEAMGPSGWTSLEDTLEEIPESLFTIADAKRADIGNTSMRYAEAFFGSMDFDSVTVAPYMGKDSVSPFIEREDKWAIVLGLTSNVGSNDFQMQQMADGRQLYEHVLQTCAGWGTPDNLMFVIGATHPDDFTKVRSIIPDHFLLVPGIGAQGGDLEAVSRKGMNDHCGLLVNSSRGIIYASQGEDFAEAARAKALELQQQMARLLDSILG